MNIPKWGGRRFRRLLSLYRRQGCVKQLPQEYRMIDTRKKQLYQPAPLLAGHVSIDLEVKKNVLNIVSRFTKILEIIIYFVIIYINNNNTKQYMVLC